MRRMLLILSILAVAALTLRARASMEPGLDYFADASDAIDALARGDWSGFAAAQPLMGSFSLFVRAPFVALDFGGSLESVYYLGVLPCLLALAVLGVVVGRRVDREGAGRAAAWVAGGLVVLNPLTFRALHWGHPEELLAAALCVGAVLCVLGGRDILGAVLLGLAVATKQWAVLAILPVLLAGPRRPFVVALLAGAIAAALTIPLLLADPGRFGAVTESAAGQSFAGASTTPWNIWWPLADLASFGARSERWLAPSWVGTISHPLIVLVAAPLAFALWRRRDRRADDALLLMTLLLLLRCLLDNWNNEYYHVPFLVSLIAWETRRRPGVPVLSLGVTLAAGLTFWPQHRAMFADSTADAPLFFTLYVSWAVPLALGLGTLLLRPDSAVLRRFGALLARDMGGLRVVPGDHHAAALTPGAGHRRRGPAEA